MTHDQWERGGRLTIHNATKDQLKWMVKDRDEQIRNLMEERDQLSADMDALIAFFVRKLSERD